MKDTNQLNELVEKLQQLDGILSVTRVEDDTDKTEVNNTVNAKV